MTTAPKTILKSLALQDYILNTSALPREHEQLKGIREATSKVYGDRAKYMIPVDEGQLLSMLLKIMNAKKTLEIGVFTGYSLLTTALALPDDGLVAGIDTSKESYDVGLPYIRNAGMEHKIKFVHSDAETALDELLTRLRNGEVECFDLIFDADKVSYGLYHEKAMELVKIGGIVAYDNTLRRGLVVEEECNIEEFRRAGIKAIKEFNEHLASDSRVEISQVSIGDGLTLCRRIV